jgi:hypothetical protein
MYTDYKSQEFETFGTIDLIDFQSYFYREK